MHFARQLDLQRIAAEDVEVPRPLSATVDEGFSCIFKYDPNQPRAKDGKWTKDGAGTAEVSSASGRAMGLSRVYDDNDAEISVEEALAEVSEADAQEIRERLERVASLPQTKDQFSDGNGNYTLERKKKHKEIFESFFNEESIRAATPAPGEQPTAIVLGGRGGSGKSAFTYNERDKTPAKIQEFDSKKFIVLDSDKIKAGQYHEESSDLFKIFRDEALQRGLNVVLDLTLNSKSVEAVLKDAKETKNYRVEGHYMYAPRALAMRRAVKRYIGKDGNRGRLVPLKVINTNTSNEKNFEDLSESLFDRWSAYDGRADGEPRVIARGERKRA
jgi:predicted ABC-type ATPase